MARIDQPTSTSLPLLKTVPDGAGGSTLPRSPCFAMLVLVYSASPPFPRYTPAGPPPAIPQGWYTGALPGALHRRIHVSTRGRKGLQPGRALTARG